MDTLTKHFKNVYFLSAYPGPCHTPGPRGKYISDPPSHWPCLRGRSSSVYMTQEAEERGWEESIVVAALE